MSPSDRIKRRGCLADVAATGVNLSHTLGGAREQAPVAHEAQRHADGVHKVVVRALREDLALPDDKVGPVPVGRVDDALAEQVLD